MNQEEKLEKICAKAKQLARVMKHPQLPQRGEYIADAISKTIVAFVHLPPEEAELARKNFKNEMVAYRPRLDWFPEVEGLPRGDYL